LRRDKGEFHRRAHEKNKIDHPRHAHTPISEAGRAAEKKKLENVCEMPMRDPFKPLHHLSPASAVYMESDRSVNFSVPEKVTEEKTQYT
jgi:hypothetical protein